MTKLIAERFADEVGSEPRPNSVTELYALVLTWLVKQPENKMIDPTSAIVEPEPTELEKAAEEYGRQDGIDYSTAYNAYLAGAKWLAEKLKQRFAIYEQDYTIAILTHLEQLTKTRE